MSRRSRYGTRTCRHCGARVTTNAMGKAAHERSKRCDRTWQYENNKREREKSNPPR